MNCLRCLLFVTATFFSHSNSCFALEYQKVTIYHNGNGWRYDHNDYQAKVIPQRESVADTLRDLDVTRKFECEVRLYEDKTMEVAPVFAIRSCLAL